MHKRLRSVTDNIHKTIYISELEAEFIATEYFNRLHDVYQCSTAYKNFSSNRTKRYEHSLGTMQVATDMFFYSIANAEDTTFSDFFKNLCEEFETILKGYRNKNNPVTWYYKSRSRGEHNGVKTRLEEVLRSDKISNSIRLAMQNRIIADTALSHYIPSNFEDFSIDEGDTASSKMTKKREEVAKNAFLYQCFLQAIRLAALFHDIGHPPHSHTMEKVIECLFEACKDDMQKEETERQFHDDFRTTVIDSYNNIHNTNANSSLIKFQIQATARDSTYALHECIGVRMVCLAIEQRVPDLLISIAENSDPSLRKLCGVKILYHLVTLDYMMAILQEKTTFFAAMHRIVDGTFDADRLDYIVRDTLNSGVNWGIVPYRRLIESAKLARPDEENQNFFAIAYPRKMMDDVNDVLETRYKIFARINGHHRTVLDATLLREAVHSLAILYLKSGQTKQVDQVEQDEQNDLDKMLSGIEKLWSAPGHFLFDQKNRLSVATWNDSWLISYLYDVLQMITNKADGNPGLVELEDIKIQLNQILLGVKSYHTLYKRGSDLRILFSDAMKDAKISNDAKRLHGILVTRFGAKVQSDGQREILRKLEGIIKFAYKGLDGIQRLFPIDFGTIVKDALINERNSQSLPVGDVIVQNNICRESLGLPNRAENSTTQMNSGRSIFLYSSQGKTEPYYLEDALRPLIEALQSTCAECYVFVAVKSLPATEQQIKMEDRLNELRDKIKSKLIEALKNEFFTMTKEWRPKASDIGLDL